MRIACTVIYPREVLSREGLNKSNGGVDTTLQLNNKNGYFCALKAAMYLRNWNVQLGELNGYDKLMYIPNDDKKIIG